MEYTVHTAEQLASVLKGFRVEQGLTQQQLGEQVGMFQKTISGMEHSLGSSSVERLFRLLSGLDVEIVLRSRSKGPGGKKKPEW